MLIADDHTLFREGVKALLSTIPDIEVVGEAADGNAALKQFRALHPQEMLGVIRAVAEGQALFGPSIATRISRFFKEVAAIQPQSHGSPSSSTPILEEGLSELSDREKEVLDLIAAGYNNAEIAQRLVLSPKTVRNHITCSFSKLQVADRAHAIRKARGAGE